jgi:hypothetical protein
MRSCFSPPLQGLRFFSFQMIYELSENWRIEDSIDVDQNLGLAIAADPVLLTTVAVMGQPELDVFTTLGDVIDRAGFVDVRTSIRGGFARHHSKAKRCHSLRDDV